MSAARTWKCMYQESDAKPLHQNGRRILRINCFLLSLVFTFSIPDTSVF